MYYCKYALGKKAYSITICRLLALKEQTVYILLASKQGGVSVDLGLGLTVQNRPLTFLADNTCG